MALQLSERFEIVKEIGRGSRGVVYLAADRAKGRDVALKVFAPTFSEFQNEIGILSDLHNPFLVEIYDFGFDPTQQTYFLAEEYFDGEPLARWAGRLGFQRVAEITARLCQVLQFLHQQGVFHGDLKPNNILINDTSDNNLKLVDFGLARKMPAAEDRTFASVATVSGTLPYLAPELFLGAPASGRSDLYSLGATLYELVGGHPPFAGPDALTLIEKHLFEMPMNPVPAGSSIPKEFGQLILKLLQKDPSARFEEANDLIRALNLHFNFTFRLGPEKPVLSPELTHELEKKHVERLYEWAVPYYANRTDAESRRLLAEIHYRQGKWDDAEALLKGLEGFRAALLTLQIAVRKGRFEWVRTEAVRLLPEAASAGQRGLLLTVLGEAYFALGQYAEAEQTFREAEREAETAGDHAAHATLLAHVGTLAVRRGAWEEARQHLEQGVTISREIGDVQNEGLALLGLGILAAAQGNGDAAIPLYQQSEAILETIGYRPGIAKVKCHFADLYLHTGSLENGEEKLRQSEAIALEIGDQCLIAHSRMLAAHLLKMKGNLPEAIEAYREAKRCFQALHCPYEEALVHQSLAACEGDGAKENMPVSVSPAAPPAAEAPTPLLGRVFEIN
ncbi:MAG: serine/threonine protein kinase, partial [Deltaproteobacteria bacterium]|nr:serine/threonine protein kinase [Deltaproteobacteria bacterium]